MQPTFQHVAWLLVFTLRQICSENQEQKERKESWKVQFIQKRYNKGCRKRKWLGLLKSNQVYSTGTIWNFINSLVLFLIISYMGTTSTSLHHSCPPLSSNSCVIPPKFMISFLTVAIRIYIYVYTYIWIYNLLSPLSFAYMCMWLGIRQSMWVFVLEDN